MPGKRKIQRHKRLEEGSPVTSNSSINMVGTTPPCPHATYQEDTVLKVDQLQTNTNTPPFVYLLTVFSALGGFLFGYDTGVISGAMILLREHFELSSVWQELIVSVTIAAAALFALIGASLNDLLGRKPVILLGSLIFTVGAVTMGLAQNRETLLVGRIIVGSAIGLTSMTIPVYLAEASAPENRGRLVSTNMVMIAFGQFIANVVDGAFSYDKHTGWRYMLGLGGVPGLLQFISFIFLPESPRWLVQTGQLDRAREVLRLIRGQTDIEEEFYSIKQNCDEIEQEIEARDDTNVPIIWQMIKAPPVRRALFLGCSLQMFQQLAGINTVMYYSATIIKMSGVKSESTAIWLSALTAGTNFIFTFLGLYLVEKIGRRPLTLASLSGAVLSLVWLAIGFHLVAGHSPPVTFTEPNLPTSHCTTYQSCNACMGDVYCGYCYMDSVRGAVNASCLQTEYSNPSAAILGRCNDSVSHKATWAYDYCPTNYSWMPMVGLVLYLMFFAPGMGPMPWTINSEIYPLWARSTGNGAATFVNWIFNLAVSMSFLSLTEELTRYGTFWLYAILASVGVVFLAIFLPETKGKNLEEVEGLFVHPWCGQCKRKIQEDENPLPAGNPKSVQYVHIRGLNRDCRESEMDSPD